MKEKITAITRAAMMITNTTPPEPNNEPRGTPEFDRVVPDVWAVGTRTAYSSTITTNKIMPIIAFCKNPWSKPALPIF